MYKVLVLLSGLILPCFNALTAEFSLASHVHRDNLKIGFETAKWDYREFNKDENNQQIMKDSGDMKGFNINYSNLYKSTNIFWFADWVHLKGATVYDGQYNDGTPVTINTQNTISSFKLGAGKAVELVSLNGVWDFSLALKGRLLKNSNSGVQGDYSREISYTMVPVSTSLDFVLESGHILGFQTTYNHLLIGTVTSRIGEAIENHPTVENTQNQGRSWNFRGHFTFVGDSMSFSISPYYRIYEIKDSDLAEVQVLGEGGEVLETRYYFEPANKTKMTGVNFTVNF